MPPEHQDYQVFRRQEDIDAMRELVNWLRNGGMDELRAISQLSQDYKTFREVGFKHVIKSIWNILIFSTIMGLGYFFAKIGFDTVANGQ